jgi:hypothetical protein
MVAAAIACAGQVGLGGAEKWIARPDTTFGEFQRQEFSSICGHHCVGRLEKV